jgi:hypothetical protein
MDEKRPLPERLGAIEGADEGALGVTPPPEPASPAARVDDAEELVPGARFGDEVPDEPKPWFTSLAAESHQAGVANEHGDAHDRQFPQGDDEAVEDDPGR